MRGVSSVISSIPDGLEEEHLFDDLDVMWW